MRDSAPDTARLRLLVGLALAIAVTCTACGEVPTAAPSPAPTTSSSPATPTASESALESAAPRPSASSPGSSGDTTPTETSAPTTAPAQISTYADDLALAGDRLTYTRLNWYWGKAAKARCKAKKIKSEFEWCNDYYYENTKKKGSGTMTTDAKIKILDDDGQPITASTAELAVALRQDSWPHWRVWLSGTEVVRLEQVFTP